MKNFTVLVLVSLFSLMAHAQEIIWNVAEPFTSQNIIAKAGIAPITIVIENSIDIENTVDVPANVTLKFESDGMLHIVNEASSVVINGGIEANIKPIFDVSARGVTSYRFESISNITLKATDLFYPEWWGILPNIVPGKKGDSGFRARHHTYLKEMMLDIAASGGGIIQFSEGIYYIRDIVIDSDNITVLGKGKETILRFDRENFGISTRRGGLFSIQGPTLEKYFSTVFPDGVHIAGNFLYDKDQYPIRNIKVKDLMIEWHDQAAKEDPSMNGLSIVNAINVEIDNVHVNLFGANRAFYVGSIFDGDTTENITIKNCSGKESRTGVFILHGYDSKDYIRRKLSLGNILIENNVFDVVSIPELDIKNDHIVEKYLDKYATGFYFIGNEFTKSFDLGGVQIVRNVGPVTLRGNTINNADIGLRSWLPLKDERKNLIQKVVVEDNIFNNFRYVGIYMPFAESIIKNNTFVSKQLTKLPKDFSEQNEEGFIATAIHVAKGPWNLYKSKQGPENVLIEGNKIFGCYLGTIPIVVEPNNEARIEIRGNIISYDSSCSIPQNDIIITTSRRKFRTKKATIILYNNLEDRSNQGAEEASVLFNVKRKKHITILQNEKV